MLVLLHNLGEGAANIQACLSPADGSGRGYRDAVLLDLFDGDNVPLEPDGSFSVKLGRYGYRWFRVHRKGDRLAP
jgi:hypothetical protein